MTPDPRDYLLYVVAASDERLQAVSNRLAALGGGSDSEELSALRFMVDTVRSVLQESALPFCPQGLDAAKYADGRPVTSVLDMEPPYYHRHSWHPDLAHPENQPHEIAGRFRLSSGSEWSVIVSAPGILDTIRHSENDE